MKCIHCGREIAWDDYHRPTAWRHVETVTRWCSLDHVRELGPMAVPSE